MKNALILHGTNSTPQSNWFPWLKENLQQKGWNVFAPQLPHADRPNIQRYNDFLFHSGWKPNNDSVIIGHSSGAVAILGLLQDLRNDVVVNTCILVGAFKDNLGRDDLSELFVKPFNFKKIKNHAKKFIFIHSDNDPYCPLDHAKYLAEKLKGELIVKKGQGHFNVEVGPAYKQFPFLLHLLNDRP
jgi:predicted alpha/beta hydrolase family esterase